MAKSFLAALAALILTAGIAGCEQEDCAEGVGERIDNAVERTGDAVGDATEEAGDKVEDATE